MQTLNGQWRMKTELELINLRMRHKGTKDKDDLIMRTFFMGLTVNLYLKRRLLDKTLTDAGRDNKVGVGFIPPFVRSLAGGGKKVARWVKGWRKDFKKKRCGSEQ